MISKNKKRTYFYYMPYECNAVEEYLESMAEKGWLLESTKGALFKFKRIEPQKLKFSVDIFNKVSVFDHKDTDVALEYREYCEAAGWKYICQSNKVQFFYTEEEKEVVSIHTDEKEKYKLLFKCSLPNVLLQLFITMVFAMNLYIQLFLNASEFLLTNNMMLSSSVIMFFMIVTNIGRIIEFIFWVIKSKVRLKRNLVLECGGYK
ncbi:DUF2812 domain-containing protein [Clostridium cellulovorans]|uniref:DUF2812 domain-containing protein n=1 Tax=Clostridium cellulovorans (strain ATCC 35296 / DSM 3052 / OCM 3 / 743B) TaxID=573061 RepID=D9SKS0_CLOC7|nr:DUF2812 domain-containing protein [Clostridium cellulovorans]ADL53492.1 Protein of unknown function DUF2812 [Clostridium cellulovorans 743B]